MDDKQLKSYLIEYSKKHGMNSLSDIEIAFMLGKIPYIGYLNRCYADYSKNNFEHIKKGCNEY